MSIRLLGVLGLCVAVVGCGDKPAPKAPPPPSPPPGEPVLEAPDLSPVARPAEVVVVGRVARPRLLVETLAKWSNVPLKLEDMLPGEAQTFASAVSWEAPIDAVVALDAFGQGTLPAPLVVGSVGLKSLDAGLSAAEALQMPARKIAPGIYRVGDFSSTSCAVAASVGAAPARLVCGRSNKDVDALLPYVTRGLSSEPLGGADFELVASAKPIQERYGQQIGTLRLFAGIALREAALDVPRFDKALADAIHGGIDETINLFQDLDQLRVEARLDATRSVLVGSAEVRLKGDGSWTAGTLSALKPTPVPSELPRVVPGSTAAFWSTSQPTERYAALIRILGELGEGYLEHEKLPEPVRKKARRAWDAWFGNLPESFSIVVPRADAAREPQAYLRSDSMLVRSKEPAARWLGAATDLFGLVGDPALKRWAKQKYKLSDKAWPKTAKRPLKLAGFKAPATLFELTVEPKELAAADPALAKVLERALSVGPSAAKMVMVVQPDGDATYVLRGDDVQELTRVMSEHRKSEPGQAFAKPAGSDKVLGAGYITLRLLARYLERAAQEPKVGHALAATRARGETPIPFASTATAGSARFDFELPAAVLGDAAAAAVQAGPALKDAVQSTTR